MPNRRDTAGRPKAFDPVDLSSTTDLSAMETAMYNMAFALRFLSQSFLGREDLEYVDSSGFEGLSVILECMADRIEAMEAAYARITGARITGARTPGGGKSDDGDDG